MKKLNFEKLKSISTPEEWLENTLNIPNKKKTDFLPFYRHTSFLISAACISLCAIVGIIMLFNSLPDKSPASNDVIVSTTVKTDNEGKLVTLQNSDLQPTSTQNNEKSTDNQTVSQVTQAVTEPPENNGKNSDSDITGESQAAANDSNTENTSPSSNAGGNEISATSDFSDSENTVETKKDNSDSNGTGPEEITNTIPTQAIPQTTAPIGVFSNWIYLHVNFSSNFNFLNAVGCHIKDGEGNELYSYNSVYEECVSMGTDSPSWNDVCIIYENWGPNQIKYGLYEVIFYDVNGNTISETVYFSDNNSVHIFM